MTWRWLHDCFVYLGHRFLTRHNVALDVDYDPPKPICLKCDLGLDFKTYELAKKAQTENGEKVQG